MVASNEDLDAAKRLSGIVNSMVVLHPTDVVINSWIAVSLADGGTDGVLYDSRANAVKHQIHETQCAYLSLRAAPAGMGVQEAYVYIKFHRDAYNAGYRLTDPEKEYGGYDLQMPIAIEDVRTQVRRLHRNRKAK
jgi:hypothetical protein